MCDGYIFSIFSAIIHWENWKIISSVRDRLLFIIYFVHNLWTPKKNIIYSSRPCPSYKPPPIYYIIWMGSSWYIYIFAAMIFEYQYYYKYVFFFSSVRFDRYITVPCDGYKLSLLQPNGECVQSIWGSCLLSHACTWWLRRCVFWEFVSLISSIVFLRPEGSFFNCLPKLIDNAAAASASLTEGGLQGKVGPSGPHVLRVPAYVFFFYI